MTLSSWEKPGNQYISTKMEQKNINLLFYILKTFQGQNCCCNPAGHGNFTKFGRNVPKSSLIKVAKNRLVGFFKGCTEKKITGCGAKRLYYNFIIFSQNSDNDNV